MIAPTLLQHNDGRRLPEYARSAESDTAADVSAGPPPWRVYGLTPRQATVVLAATPSGGTRWRF